MSDLVGESIAGTIEVKDIVTGEVIARLDDLKGVELARADFSSVKDLTEVDLTDAKLEAAKFRTCDASGGKFVGATMPDVDFRNAKLAGVDFTGATLTRADFRGSEMTGANFTGCDLRGANFRGVDISSVEFSGANLFSANLQGCSFPGSVLANAVFAEKVKR